MRVHACQVCSQPLPETLDQSHHVVPQAAGGEKGATARLCAGCHHDTHRVADMLLSGRASLAEDSVKIAHPDQEVQRRLFALAKTCAEYMQLKRDGKLKTDQPVNVMIQLPPRIKLAAQVIANEHRGPTGRNLGLARWISALVTKQVRDRYPDIEPY